MAIASRPSTPTLPTRATLASVAILPVAHAINDSYAFVLQAMLPAVIANLGLSLSSAGVLVSVYQLVSSFVQPVVGHIADRGALRWPSWAGVLMSGLGAGLLGLAPDYAALLVLLIIGGVGTAIFHPVTGAMVGAAAPPAQRGRWMGLYVTAGNFGLALGPLMLSVALAGTGLSGTWMIALPALLIAPLVMILAPSRAGPPRNAPSLLEILRNHRRVLSVLIFIVSVRAWITATLVTFIPLLGVSRAMPEASAAQVLSLYLFFGALGGLSGGYAADRWGRDRMIALSLLLSVPPGLLVGSYPHADLLWIMAAAAHGYFLNGSFVILTIRAQESVTGSVGMMSGIMLGLTIGIGGLFVTPMAALAQVLGLAPITTAVVTLAIIAAAAVRALPPLHARPAAL